MQAHPNPTHAAEYAVLLLSKYGQPTWREQTRCTSKDDAIETARRHLRLGAKAAQVQGRGTVDRPTPPSQLVVYRGVAAGYDADKLHGGALQEAPEDVERVE